MTFHVRQLKFQKCLKAKRYNVSKIVRMCNLQSTISNFSNPGGYVQYNLCLQVYLQYFGIGRDCNRLQSVAIRCNLGFYVFPIDLDFYRIYNLRFYAIQIDLNFYWIAWDWIFLQSIGIAEF